MSKQEHLDKKYTTILPPRHKGTIRYLKLFDYGILYGISDTCRNKGEHKQPNSILRK